MSSRTTRQREAVLRALTESQGFISARELHDRVTADGTGVALTTVYRTLRDLDATGGVDVVRDEAGDRLYRRRPTGGHRHYLICRCCGRSHPVDAQVVERWAGEIAKKHGFAGAEPVVGLTGLCAGCQPAADKGDLTPCNWGPAQPRSRACAS